jgi:uncharacterized glyoxalase superfamily protein PhnB
MAQKAPKPVPDGMHTVTPHLWFNGNCRDAVEFYKKALGAEVIGQIVPSPDGKGVWHAMVKIGDSTLMLADARAGSWEKGPDKNSTMSIWLYVEDCDAVFNNALKNGCQVIFPMADMFWGDRTGKLKDPYGHCWAVATFKWIYTPQEMKQKELEMMAKMPQN